MKLSTRNLHLAALLALLVVGNLFIGRSGSEASSSDALFPAVDLNRVARIVITSGASTDAGVELERVHGGWNVKSEHDFPAYRFPVTELLVRVMGLDDGDPVSREASSHESLGVGQGATHVTLFDEGGARLAEFLQGAAAGGAGSVVRLPGESDVWRAPALAPLNLDPAHWLDRKLVALDLASAVGVHVRLGDVGLSADLMRERDGTWRSLEAGTEARVPAALVEQLLRAVSSLVFREVTDEALAPGLGFESPPRVLVEIDVGGPELVSLLIGSPIPRAPDDAGAARYATNPHWAQPWVVSLSEASCARVEAAVRQVCASVSR